MSTEFVAPIVANSVIIIASGRSNFAAAGSLDKLINNVISLKKKPVVVVGPDGDELLRTSSEIEKCEMVFDPNFDGGFFSSVKAGLEAVNGPSFVLPLEESEKVHPDTWKLLEKTLIGVGRDVHVIRPAASEGEPCLFPQIITAHGLRPLKELPADTDWFAEDLICALELPLTT